MQRCLDDVLDDGRFLDIIRERLSEWDGDVDDDQFVAVWSAADYRLKFYNSLSNGNMKIENLMKAFAEVGFIPQFDVCGPPTINLENIDVSPKGDLVSVSNLSSDYYGYDKRYITLILAGTMLPLTMIPLGTGYRQVHAFSNDSRYLAAVCDDRISIWDIFNLRRIAAGMIERLDDYPLITWSEDSSHVCVRSNGHIYSMSVEGGEIRELLSLGGKMTNLVLDRNGSVIMALYLQEVRFVDTLTDTVLSSYPLPVTFSGVALAYHLNGLFRIVAGGYVMLTAHDRAPEIIMDHRQDLELLMDSVDNAERYWCRNAETLWWGYSDLRHNRVSFECAEYIHSKTIRCDIDTTDLSYNISAEPNNPLMEKPPAPKRQENVKPPETVDPLSILNEGRTLDFFHEGKIVRMRHVETRGNYELFVIREYRTDAPYQRYEYRFIEPGFMDSYPDLPTEVTGQMVERYEYYKLTGGSNGRHIFYLVGGIGRIKSAEIPFVKRFPRDPDAMVWEKIDQGTDRVYYISFSEKLGPNYYEDTDSWFICDGERICELLFPSPKRMKYLNRGLCHNSDGLFQIDPVRKTFELILSNQIITENGLLMEDVCYDNGKVIAIKVRGNKRTLVSVEPSTGKVVPLDVTLPKEHSKFTCARGIVFYARDYTIKAFDGSDGHELFDIDLSDFSKWLVLGCNDKGIVSLAKLKLKSTGNFSTHAEIDLGRMMPDTYEIEKFESAHISLDCLFFRKNELHLRGNKVIYRNSTSNPQRPYTLTYGLIKKNGVSKGKSLMPDISRLSSSIIKVSDDRYVLITNGSVTEEPQISSESEGPDMHKDEERDDQTRPLMRLMSPATGRMVRLNKNHNSEGMMYGCNGYDIRDSVAVSLKGGSFLAVEFSNDTDTIVSTRDVSTGKEYPEGGEAVCGKILDSDEDTILVGLMNKGDRLSRITKAVRYDHHMIPIPGTEMNIPVQLWRGVKPWRFCSDSESIRLVDYSFDGLPLKRIGIPGDPQTFYSDFTEADTYLPAIIPVRVLETFKKVSAPCAMNSSQWLSDTVWYKTQVVICTIHRGILIDEVPTELLIPSNKEDAPMDGILNTINNYIFMDFVDNGYLLTEQYRDDNLPTDLWPYHSFLIGYDGKRTEIASDIIGPTDGREKESRAVSMLYGKIGYVHRIGNVCEHVLFGSDHTIYVPGNNPFSIYRDENLSVTYQETDGGALIITDGSATEMLPMPHPIQITNMRRDRNGDLHLFFQRGYYCEELFIPAGIHGANVCLPKTSPKSRTTYLGRYRLYSCHGLYGIIDDGTDS